MKLGPALAGLRRLFLDTAPIIYYVENIAPYRQIMDLRRCKRRGWHAHLYHIVYHAR